ncbi:MAG: helicase [Treponema sp.]|nr:helicase [Treponema sp.]
MASKFLTNTSEKTSLAERIKALTKASSRLDFLVGYFFFSGFCEIRKDLIDKPLRILIGMDAQVDINNCIVEYTTNRENRQNFDSKLAIRNNYFKNLKNIINKADIIDTAEFEKSYKVFLEKLENGTLEVRKTRDPNHAKMYLFYMPPEKTNSGLDESKLIVGSSNFSIQGFKARNEINIYLLDAHDFNDGSKIFENLWEESIELINRENKDEFKKEVIGKIWPGVVPSPYLIYVRVLYEFFKETDEYIKTPKEITRDKMNEFFDVSYQVDAIREGVTKIKKHSGVIVADVVGLGKSIIASAIAANLDRQTVIVSPPHLKTQWEDYASDFGLRIDRVYTPGKIEEAANKYKNTSDLVIIIDEAHRYRNENTESYGFLHQLCAGNKVILLSATPFNNKPEDIFSLIKLFQIPVRSTIQTVNDLGNQMAKLVNEYKNLKKVNREAAISEVEFDKQSNDLAQKIREVLEPVIIRRTRIDLEKLTKYKTDLESQGIQFSEVKPPESQTYELGTLSKLYINTLEQLTDETKGLKGTRYKPLTYLRKDKKDNSKIDKELIKKYSQYFEDVENFITGQKNMAGFMKQLLVRRFESSKYSFIQSLNNIYNSMQTLRRWFVELKQIPMSRKVKLPDIDTLKDSLVDDEDTDLFAGTDEMQKCRMAKEREKGFWYIDAKDMSDEFLVDLDADIALISNFLKLWQATKEDPKLKSIINNIKTSLEKEPSRKIIIFTEFSDTADYLFNEFEKSGLKVMMYSSKKASKEKRNEVRANFDAGYPEKLQQNRIDVLVATDAISEGFSLHRAGTIYNYDIPYNPTRVIQRVGRINRINKKVFDELYIFNFFPTTIGEKISRTAEISTFKMKLFQAILGADTQILTEDETLEGYLEKEFTEAQNSENSISWDVEFRNELYQIEKTEKKILDDAKELPQRCRIARKNRNYKKSKEDLLTQELFENIQEKGVLLFSKKGDAYRFSFTAQDGSTEMINPEQAMNLFKATKEELGMKASESFYPLYENAKAQSGLVKVSKQKSDTTNAAIKMIRFLAKSATGDDKSYLEEILKVINMDCLPVFYAKKIARMDHKNVSIIKDIQKMIPIQYIAALLDKYSKIDSEPETILLAEELT